MKILVIGSGGREHALCWKLSQSPKCEKIYCAPGNGGIADIADCVNIKPSDINLLMNFAKSKDIDLTVVGPEVPLVAGIVDAFEKEGLKVFGPSKELSRLEGSKVFAKEIMRRFKVPTADFSVFTDYEKACAHVRQKGAPLVIKADGLCAGKGVVVARTVDEALDALKKMMNDRVFGAAGETVIVEECLSGEEASIIVISDGKNVVYFSPSQDHKRALDKDRGPNTGGMGAYSPAPVVTDAIFKQVVDTVILPIIGGLSSEGRPYKGVLYAGIMITAKGPQVLEFNVRFGDPETQAILPRLKTDLVEVIERSVSGKFENYRLEWDPRPCVTVVLASGGYPGSFENGMEIKGLNDMRGLKDVVVFHAGTRPGRRATDTKGLLITSGGRVLDVTALGDTVAKARETCYAAIKKIYFNKMHYRTDIGLKAIERK